jgi:hypothetical protein
MTRESEFGIKAFQLGEVGIAYARDEGISQRKVTRRLVSSIREALSQVGFDLIPEEISSPRSNQSVYLVYRGSPFARIRHAMDRPPSLANALEIESILREAARSTGESNNS